MDKLKTRVLFISLIMLALISVSAVAAADVDDVISANQDDFDLSEETNDVEQLNANAQEDTSVNTDSNDVLTAGETLSFSELQAKIDAAQDGDTIVLEDNYLMSSDDKPIFINKTLTIDGQGYTIDANHLNATLASISQVTLKNIVFINANCTKDIYMGSYLLRGGVNLLAGSDGSSIENCTFKDNVAKFGAGVRWISDNGKITDSRFCR